MRRLYITFVSAILLCANSLSAQIPVKNHDKIFDDIFNVQWSEIVKALELNAEKSSELKSLYESYMRDFWSSDNRPRHHFKCAPMAQDLSDKDAQEAIMADFERTQKMLDIRKLYYQRFLSVLTPSQIYKMYTVERHVKGRIFNEMERRKDATKVQGPYSRQPKR